MKDKKTPILWVVHKHEDTLEKMHRERWPDVSRAEWKEMRAEIIEEIEA
jgi:hypothetical protein